MGVRLNFLVGGKGCSGLGMGPKENTDHAEDFQTLPPVVRVFLMRALGDESRSTSGLTAMLAYKLKIRQLRPGSVGFFRYGRENGVGLSLFFSNKQSRLGRL